MTGCWLLAVVVIHLLNAWHTVSHHVIKHGYWSDPNNSNYLSVQGERTLPAWFSGVMLWTAGLGLVALMAVEFKRRKSIAMLWGLLGIAFFYLSADEVVGLHENLNAPARQMLGTPESLDSPWIIFGLLYAGLIGLACIPLLVSLNKTIRNTMILAGVVYLSGAVGVEVIGETIKRVMYDGQPSKLYTLCYCIEELLEMLGVVLLLHAIHLQIVSYLPLMSIDARRANSLNS